MRKLISNGKCVPYDPNLKLLARDLRNNATPQEQKVWYFLRELKFKFVRQKPLLTYIVDFYCAKKKLVIEIDGLQYYDEFDLGQDQVRTQTLNNIDIQVIRFTNKEVDDDFPFIRNQILNILDN